MNKREIIENKLLGEKLVRIRHRSGLDIYVLNKEFTEYTAFFGTRYGSCDSTLTDSNGHTSTVPAGIAHFLEHKMFESPDGEDVSAGFAALGADANAYTSADTTVYLFTCTERFYEALELLIKMVTTPYFTPENVKKEKGIISEEIRMCRDSVSDALHYLLMGAMYGEHPAAVPIAGTVDSISKITPSLLYACYNSYYRSSNMVMSVCGRIDPDEVERVVDRALPGKETPKVIFDRHKDTIECARKRAEREMEVSIPVFRIGIKYPEGDFPAACQVLSEILFGECEELYCSLYEKGLLSEYYSYGYACRRTAPYFAAGGDSDDPEAVFEAFCEYAGRLRERGVSAEALERARRVMYADALKSLDSAEAAESIFDSAILGMEPLGRAEEFLAVTIEDVNALAGRVLSPERFAMSVVYPKAAENKKSVKKI